MNEPEERDRADLTETGLIETGVTETEARAGHGATVWPPPPTNTLVAPLSLGSAYSFAPVRPLAWVLIALLALYAGLCVLELALTPLPPTTFRQIDSMVGVAQFLLLLVTGVCFLIWTYRLNQNLRAFGVTGLQFTPGWAVGYFFVPVMSLYRPYQIFREIWQASDAGVAPRDGQAWQNIHPPALLGFWWVVWMLSNVVDRLVAQSPNDPSAVAAGAACTLVAAILALLVVHLWTARQEKTARHLSLIP